MEERRNKKEGREEEEREEEGREEVRGESVRPLRLTHSMRMGWTLNPPHSVLLQVRGLPVLSFSYMYFHTVIPLVMVIFMQTFDPHEPLILYMYMYIHEQSSA